MAKGLCMTIYNSLEELNLLFRVIRVFLEPEKLEQKTLYAVELVLEELIVNTINYAYDDDLKHEIHIIIELEEDNDITLTIEDDGKPFNPLTVKHLDDSGPAREKIEEVGLGINVVRHLRSLMEYRRVNDKNILKIWLT